MIKDRRYTGNMIYIDFFAKESFQNYPTPKFLTMTLVTDGTWEFSLNQYNYNITAPFIFFLNDSDDITIKSTGNYAAKTFIFHPAFINSSLTEEAIFHNTFENIEVIHDRNLIDVFLRRTTKYHGLLSLDAPSALQINSWMSMIGIECLSQSDGRWTCRARKYLLQILFFMEDLFLVLCNDQILKKKPIDYALEYIQSNYNLGLTLEGISKHVGVNRTTLNNMCKQKTGMTLIQYLNNYRLKVAKETLSHTNLTLSEISISCGYNYESYFIKTFTDNFGISPNEYRKKVNM
ncbi:MULTISPECIES: helix-turn-helix domain-containing protein [Blautia]|uniref:helix-turn-helix domain-containing protein n=1 Tax=Blautia TaxID=572511 RepID=UPI000BA42A28|nr:MULTISPECIES: AraC family transcriptional regulator [Blautia]